MKECFKKISGYCRRNQKSIIAFLVVFAFLGLMMFLFSDSVLAQTASDAEKTKSNKTASLLGIILANIASFFIRALGLLFTAILNVTVAVANYNDFSKAQAIILGWVVVRDICNMFFILILLVIAFSVILRVDGYDIKKMVPKLLIMAVLINFSRTICGLIIDAAQVIMLTFIHSIKGMSGGFIEMFGIKKYSEFDANKKGVADTTQILVSSILAIIFMLIAIVVVIALLAVLVMRIVMLWIYVVLSPLAFFLASFPQGKGYSQKWWKEFSEAVIVGPVLAFFLWLSFATLENIKEGSKLMGEGVDLSKGDPEGGLTEILTGDSVIKFAVSIGMLLGGLMIAQGMAGVAGSIAGKAMGKIQAGAGWARDKTKKAIGNSVKTGAAAGLAGAGFMATKVGMLQNKVGIGSGKSMQAIGKIGSTWSGGINKSIADEKKAARAKTFKKLGLGGDEAQAALRDLADSRLGKGAKTVARATGGVMAAATSGAALGGLPAVAGVGLGVGYAVRHVAGHFMANRAKKKDAKIKEQRVADEKIMSDASKDKAAAIKPLEEKRQRVIKTATSLRDDGLKNAEKEKETALSQNKQKNQLFPADMAKENARIEKEFEAKKQNIVVTFEAEVKKANDDFQSDSQAPEAAYQSARASTHIGKIEAERAAINNNQSLSAKEKKKGLDDVKKKEDEYRGKHGSVGKFIRDYHPNKVTMDATKESLADSEKAKKLVVSLAGGSKLSDFKSNFYNGSGQKDPQKKLLKALGDGSADSIKALNHMVSSLNELAKKQSSGETLEKGDIDFSRNLKQGLAAYEKGGGDMENINVLVQAVDAIHTAKDGETADTVNDFKSSVIEKD